MKLRSAALSDDVSPVRLAMSKGLELELQPASTTRAKPAVARRKQRIVVPPRLFVAGAGYFLPMQPACMDFNRRRRILSRCLSRFMAFDRKNAGSEPSLALGGPTRVFHPADCPI